MLVQEMDSGAQWVKEAAAFNAEKAMGGGSAAAVKEFAARTGANTTVCVRICICVLQVARVYYMD